MPTIIERLQTIIVEQTEVPGPEMNKILVAIGDATDALEDARHVVSLLLGDVDALVQKYGFSAAERDSMVSVKEARKFLEG